MVESLSVTRVYLRLYLMGPLAKLCRRQPTNMEFGYLAAPFRRGMRKLETFITLALCLIVKDNSKVDFARYFLLSVVYSPGLFADALI